MSERFRVLVIDDDPGVREYMEALVSRQGYEVFAAADGEEALEKVGDMEPDLITLDVVLPGIDGLATLAQLKKKMPDVPVVMPVAAAHPTGPCCHPAVRSPKAEASPVAG